jgi:hypothetical protein
MVPEAGQPASQPPAASTRILPQRSNASQPHGCGTKRLTKTRGDSVARRSEFPKPQWAPSEPMPPDEVAAAKSRTKRKRGPLPLPGEAPAEPAANADDEPGLFDDAIKPNRRSRRSFRKRTSTLASPRQESGPRVTEPAETLDRCDLQRALSHRAGPDPALDARKEARSLRPKRSNRQASIPRRHFYQKPDRQRIRGHLRRRVFRLPARRGSPLLAATNRRNLLRNVCRRVDRSAIGTRGFSLSIHMLARNSRRFMGSLGPLGVEVSARRSGVRSPPAFWRQEPAGERRILHRHLFPMIKARPDAPPCPAPHVDSLEGSGPSPPSSMAPAKLCSPFFRGSPCRCWPRIEVRPPKCQDRRVGLASTLSWGNRAHDPKAAGSLIGLPHSSHSGSVSASSHRASYSRHRQTARPR